MVAFSTLFGRALAVALTLLGMRLTSLQGAIRIQPRHARSRRGSIDESVVVRVGLTSGHVAQHSGGLPFDWLVVEHVDEDEVRSGRKILSLSTECAAIAHDEDARTREMRGRG